MLGNWGFWLLDVDVGFENRVFVSPLDRREYQRCFPLAKRQFSREPPEADPTFPANSNNNNKNRSTPHLDCVNRIQVVSHKWFRGRAGDWKATRKGSDFSSWLLIWFKEHIRFRQKSTIYEVELVGDILVKSDCESRSRSFYLFRSLLRPAPIASSQRRSSSFCRTCSNIFACIPFSFEA